MPLCTNLEEERERLGIQECLEKQGYSCRVIIRPAASPSFFVLYITLVNLRIQIYYVLVEFVDSFLDSKLGETNV